MRTLTAQQEATLLTGAYAVHLRVRVRRPGGSDVDLGSLLGRAWVVDVQWQEGQDIPVAGATVTVTRSGPGGAVQSLSPLVVSSLANLNGGTYEPLLLVGRQFRVDVACLPAGMEPDSSDWQECFLGRITSVDAGREGLTFEGSDYYASVLQDAHIETEVAYGNDTVGVAVQTVMQSIINAVGYSGFVLYTPVDPLWQLGKYLQRREPTWDALQTLATQLGWEVRQVWRDGVGFELRFHSPDRLAEDAVWGYGPDVYGELPVVRQEFTDLRNVVEVVYSDFADKDAAGVPKRKTVTDSNPTSIATFGRRWMQVVEASNSNINSEAEAERLAAAAIADLSDSTLVLEVDVPLAWHLQVNDMVEVLPDGVSLDTTQVLAVAALAHTISSEGVGRTKLTLRGRPSTARGAASAYGWMAKNANGSVAPESTLAGPDAPGTLTASDTLRGFSLAFTPASSGARWASFELHLSTSSGFTPSTATFKVAQASTRFEVADLSPGTTYYAKAVPYTKDRSPGTASSEVTLSPRYVEPRTLQPLLGSGANVPINGLLEAWSDQTTPPDCWEMVVGTWGVDATVDTTQVHSGARSVLMNTATATSIASQRFLVVPDDELKVDAFCAAPSQGVLTTVATLYIDWFGNTSTTPASSTTIGTVVGSAGSINPYFRAKGTVTVPGLTRYARVRIAKASGAFALYVDSARVFMTPAP